MEKDEVAARAAYRAYDATVGGLNHLGRPMPRWEELGEKIQAAWKQAIRTGSGVAVGRPVLASDPDGLRSESPALDKARAASGDELQLPDLQPGDLLMTRSSGFAGRLIRIDAAMRDEPNLDNHVAVFHHTDNRGIPWAVEGRPGGVGWRDARDYLRSPWTMTNRLQPKDPSQRDLVCKGSVAMLGTLYDWQAILADAGGAFGLANVWHPDWGTVPGHVVCSSLAAYLYHKAGLATPPEAALRETTPADWEQLIIEQHWD